MDDGEHDVEDAVHLLALDRRPADLDPAVDGDGLQALDGALGVLLGEPEEQGARGGLGVDPVHDCAVQFISCSVARATSFSTAATVIPSDAAISA